jgi:hypothetical protein
MCTFLMHAPVYESSPVKEEIFHSILNFFKMFLCELRNIALLSIQNLIRVVEKCTEFFFYINWIFLKIIQIFTLKYFIFTLCF